MLGSIGMPELILIFVIALLLFGPKKLPDIGRTVGKALSEFRRASNDLKRSLEEEVASEELREVRDDLRRTARTVTRPIESAVEEEPAAPASQEPPAPPAPPKEPA